MASIFDMMAQRERRGEIYSSSDYWNGKARELEGSSASMWPNRNLNALYHDEQIERLGTLLGDLTDLDTLDLGCGTGRMSRYLAGKGAHVTGVDFAEEALEIARQNLSGYDINFRCQSVLDIDETDAYDLIVSWGVLTIGCRSRADLQNVFGRMQTALRPGGRIILMEPVHTSFLHRVLKLSERAFRDDMDNAGLVVESVEHFHFWPARLALGYIHWPGWLTRWSYAIGQFFLVKVFRRRRFGDYQLYVARRGGGSE